MLYNGYYIRPATNDDIADIKKVVFTVLKEYNLSPDESGKDSDLSNIEQNYFRGYFGVVTDRSSGAIVGTFGLFPLSAEVCELRKMYLLRQARGKGLGKFILNLVVGFARDRNYKKIVLETISPLKEAIALYRKYGFKEIPPAAINDRVDRAFELSLG